MKQDLERGSNANIDRAERRHSVHLEPARLLLLTVACLALVACGPTESPRNANDTENSPPPSPTLPSSSSDRAASSPTLVETTPPRGMDPADATDQKRDISPDRPADLVPAEERPPVRPGRGGEGGETTVVTDPAERARRQAARPMRPGAVNDITFDDLELDMPLGTLFNRNMLTPRAAQLDGQMVRLRGFIYAGGVFQQSGIKSFPFVKNTQCKFGPDGLAFCVILVNLDEGVSTDFTTYPMTVEGRLSVRPYDAEGFTWSVYHLQGRRVF